MRVDQSKPYKLHRVWLLQFNSRVTLLQALRRVGPLAAEDLPLNISREMLQNNPNVTQMRKALTGRVISELENLADNEPEAFGKVWDAFGAIIKEGIYEDRERRDTLLALARFTTTAGNDRTLKGYVADLKSNQTEIYYLDRG